MKYRLRPSRYRSLWPLLALSIGATISWGADKPRPCSEAALETSDCGSECVMVFGRVGEGFRYDLAETESVGLEAGVNAAGVKAALPRGLRLDEESAALVGVPMESGFYEFVLLRTEGRETTQQVVLLDIQGLPLCSVASDYANYFGRGLR